MPRAEEAGVRAGVYGVTFVGGESDHETCTADHALSTARGNLDLAVDHREPRAFVHLMIVEALARRDHQGDCPRLVCRGEDLRRVGCRSRSVIVQLFMSSPSGSRCRRTVVGARS